MGFDRAYCREVLETTQGALEPAISILADPSCSPEAREEARRLSRETGATDSAAPSSPVALSDTTEVDSPPSSPPPVVRTDNVKKVNQNKAKQKEAKKGKEPKKKKRGGSNILDLTAPPQKNLKMPVDLFQMLVMLAVAFAVVVVVQL